MTPDDKLKLDFEEAYDKVSDIICLPRYRAKVLWDSALLCDNLVGLIAEVGVYKGGSAKLMAQALPEKKIHLFDTFAGVPETEITPGDTPLDFTRTSKEAVAELLGQQAIIHASTFPESTKGMEDARFCLVHVDCDIYKTVKACMAYFYPRMVENGRIVIDDFRHDLHKGVDIAVLEYFRWQALIVKREMH